MYAWILKQLNTELAKRESDPCWDEAERTYNDGVVCGLEFAIDKVETMIEQMR